MRRIIKPVVTLVFVVAAVLVAAMILVPAALGLQRYVITGGSMTGTIDKGAVVYSQITPVEQLKVGDIVTFAPPGRTEPITHRIVSIDSGPGGQLVFGTKGDFNPVADPWQITFAQPQVPRHVWAVPYLGYPLAVLSIREVRLLLVGVPALAIAFSMLWALWGSAGAEVRRREAALSETLGDLAPEETW
jgi:signal peptidase